MLRFTFRQLEYFVAIGECGSIALASEKVNVSSPTMSAAIAQLEAEFKIQLFVRKHAHGLVLTQAGEEFMIQARTILAQGRQLGTLSSELSGNVQGRLNIGALATIAHIVVPGIRREFHAQYPDIETHQQSYHQVEIFEQLRSAEIDLALTYDIDIPKNLQFVPAVTLPPVVVLAEDHPLAKRLSLTLSELSDEPMIMLDLPSSVDYFESLFSHEGMRPNIVQRVRDIVVTRSLVANGFGYSIANLRSKNVIAPDGRRVVYVPLKSDVPPLKFGVLSVTGAGQLLSVRSFTQVTRDYMEKWVQD